MTDRYEIVGETVVPQQVRDVLKRRVRPFLNRNGLTTRSVEHLMCEAYLQGIKDAVDAMEHPKPSPTSIEAPK